MLGAAFAGCQDEASLPGISEYKNYYAMMSNPDQENCKYIIIRAKTYNIIYVCECVW